MGDLWHPGICVIFASLIFKIIYMGTLTKSQRSYLLSRLEYLKGKPCPVCGTLQEMQISADQYQLLSNPVKDGCMQSGIQLSANGKDQGGISFFESVGAIECPNCNYFYPFFLRID